jgi:hypothetical protein
MTAPYYPTFDIPGRNCRMKLSEFDDLEGHANSTFEVGDKLTALRELAVSFMLAMTRKLISAIH